MAAMRSLLRSRFAAHFVLAWFLATLGVAALSPAVHPIVLAMVCASDGLVTLAVDQDGLAIPSGAHTLDCALCLPVSPPPSTWAGLAGHLRPVAWLPGPVEALHVPPPAGAALPPRGPPGAFASSAA